MANGERSFVKNATRLEDQKIRKVRSPKVVKMRVGMTAGRDPVEEKVSVVEIVAEKEIAVERGIVVEKEGIEIVVGIAVEIETGEGAEVGRDEVAVVTEEAEVRIGEAGVATGIDEGRQGIHDGVEVEIGVGEPGVGIGDVAGAEIETEEGKETESVEEAIVGAGVVKAEGVVGVVTDAVVEVGLIAIETDEVTGTVRTQIGQ